LAEAAGEQVNGDYYRLLKANRPSGLSIQIRQSREEEALALTDIRVRSKGYWGYPPEILESWRPAMVVTLDYIRSTTMRSILLDGELVGFYALKKEEGLLDHLWLVPEVIGLGLGRLAYTHATQLAREIGMREFLIISDPDAEGFYLKLGAKKVGEVFSPHQNRMLPKLLFTIPEAPYPTPGAKIEFEAVHQ
jgi:hypothetical protein